MKSLNLMKKQNDTRGIWSIFVQNHTIFYFSKIDWICQVKVSNTMSKFRLTADISRFPCNIILPAGDGEHQNIWSHLEKWGPQITRKIEIVPCRCLDVIWGTVEGRIITKHYKSSKKFIFAIEFLRWTLELGTAWTRSGPTRHHEVRSGSKNF